MYPIWQTVMLATYNMMLMVPYSVILWLNLEPTQDYSGVLTNPMYQYSYKGYHCYISLDVITWLNICKNIS